MSESKRPVGTPRAPKKKPRPKTASAVELAPADEREDDEIPVDVTASAPPEALRAQESIVPAIIPAIVGGEGRIAPPPSREESEFEDEDYDRGGPPADQDESKDFSEQPRRENAPSQPPREPNAQPRRDAVAPKSRPTDEYLVQVYFDKAARAFLGTVLEFPELKASGASRETVLRDLDAKIDNLVQGLRRRNEPVPEGYLNRRTPETLEVKVSQSLFRKLDLLAKAEKVAMDQIVSELLTSCLEKQRSEPPRSQQPNSNQGRDRDRGDRQPQSNQGRQHGGQSQPGNSRNSQQPRQHGRNRNYHDTMDNRENFMEYVRNLEKGNWRKK